MRAPVARLTAISTRRRCSCSWRCSWRQTLGPLRAPARGLWIWAGGDGGRRGQLALAATSRGQHCNTLSLSKPWLPFFFHGLNHDPPITTTILQSIDLAPFTMVSLASKASVMIGFAGVNMPPLFQCARPTWFQADVLCQVQLSKLRLCP